MPGGVERPNNESRGFIPSHRFQPSRDSNAARVAFAKAVTVMAGSGASFRSLYEVGKEFSANRLRVVRESTSAQNAHAGRLDRSGQDKTRQDETVPLLLEAIFK